MLKKISILLVLLVSLCACRPSEVATSSTNKFSILSISQTPSLSLLCFSNDEYPIEVTSEISSIESAFNSKEVDIIIAPINVGVNKCMENDNYKLFSILVHSHYYICSKDESFIRGDVGVYGKGQVIEGVLNALSDDLSKYNFIYYDSLDTMYQDFDNGDIEACLLSEIGYNDYTSYKDIELYKIEDLDSVYQSVYSFSEFPTFGLFVSTSVLNNYQDDFSSFTRIMRNSISQYKNDKTTFNNVLKNADLNKLGFDNADLISETYNYCGLDFIYAVDDYDCLNTLLSSLGIELNEKLLVQ